MNIEKRQPFNRARRNEELMLKYHTNEKRCTKESSRAKESRLKLILDSRLGNRQKERLDHSTLFGIRCGKSIFPEYYFPLDIIQFIVKAESGVASRRDHDDRRGSACLASD